MITPEQYAEIKVIAERTNLSLASQVYYQANVLAMLKKLAHQSRGGTVLECLRNPVRLAKMYELEYGTDSGTGSGD